MEANHPHIFWTPCVVHTLHLTLKNIYAAKNTKANKTTYEKCNWITEASEDALLIKNFIMNHSLRLIMFNEHMNVKLLVVADTRFALVIITLRRFKTIKRSSRLGA